MKGLQLTKNREAIIDDEDFEFLNQWKWSIHQAGRYQYAARQNKGKIIKLHRLLMKAKAGDVVDHKNGDTLDNRRSNLRLCSKGQNNMNVKKRIDNKSGFKGVCFKRGKWMAYIQANKKWKHLGYHESAEAAALVYDIAAKEMHGEYAKVNFT